MRHLSPDRLLDLLDGCLPAAAEHAARQHLASCGECARTLRSQREVRATLRSAAAPCPDVGLLAGLMSLEASHPPAPVGRRPPSGRVIFGTTLAGGVALLALGLGPGVSAPGGAPVPSVRTVLTGMSGEGMAAWLGGGSGGSEHRR